MMDSGVQGNELHNRLKNHLNLLIDHLNQPKTAQQYK